MAGLRDAEIRYLSFDPDFGKGAFEKILDLCSELGNS
jgi:hypothetical protein